MNKGWPSSQTWMFFGKCPLGREGVPLLSFNKNLMNIVSKSVFGHNFFWFLRIQTILSFQYETNSCRILKTLGPMCTFQCLDWKKYVDCWQVIELFTKYIYCQLALTALGKLFEINLSGHWSRYETFKPNRPMWKYWDWEQWIECIGLKDSGSTL